MIGKEQNRVDKFLNIFGYNTLFLIVRTVNLAILFWIIANFLEPNKFGIYAFCIIIIEILILLSSLGISKSIPRYLAEFISMEKKSEAKALLSLVFRLKIIITITVCSGFFLINKSFPGIFDWDERNYLIWIIIACVAAGSFQDIFQNVMDSLLQYRIKLLVYSTASISQISLMYIVLLKYNSILSVFIINFSINLFMGLCFLIYNFELMPKSLMLKLHGENRKKVFNSFGYLSLSAILTFIIWQRSELFILKYYSSTYELGLYAFAFSVTIKLIKFIPSTINSILIPFISYINEQRELEKTYYYIEKYISVLSLFIATIMYLIIPNLIDYLWRGKYNDSIILCQILVISTAIVQIGNVSGAFLMRLDKQKQNFYISLIVGIINIGIGFGLIPYYHSLGAVIANSSAHVLNVILTIGYLNRSQKLKFPWFHFLVYFLIGLFFIGIFQYAHNNYDGNLNVYLIKGIIIIIYIIIFGLTLKWTHFITNDDKSILDKIVMKFPKVLQPIGYRAIALLI